MSAFEKNEQTVVTTIRIPKELREQINAIAQRERRSVNSEIIHLLELSLNYKFQDIQQDSY